MPSKAFSFALLLSLAASSVNAADTCADVFGRGLSIASKAKRSRTEPLPRNRSLVAVTPEPTTFQNSQELATHLERENRRKLLDARNAYFYYEGYLKALPPWERKAIAFYKGSGFTEINRFLRKQNPDWMNTPYLRVIADLDHAVDTAPPVPAGIVLFRGMALTDPSAVIKEPGQLITDQGFVSTSLSSHTAVNFANLNTFDGDSTKKKTSILQIITVKGRKGRGLYIDSAGSSFESEIVLDRGARFRVIKSEWKTLENKFDDFNSSSMDGVGSGGIFIPPPNPSGSASNDPFGTGTGAGTGTGMGFPSDGSFDSDWHNKAPFQYDSWNQPDPKADPMDPWNSDLFAPPLPPLPPPPIPVQVQSKILVQYVELLSE